MLRKTSHLLLTVLFAFSIGFGQQPNTPPSVERLREHVTYLASDKLDGRRTGTSAAGLAAEYIAKEFSRYGLRRSIGYDTPGMSILEADSPNRYLQKFPYVAGVDLGKQNYFRVGSSGRSRNSNSPQIKAKEFRVGTDWLPLGMSSNGQIKTSQYVFVGYGITAPELKYDSYGAEVRGRVAIALRGTPDGDNPHGQFGRYEDVRWKAVAARNAGAQALLIIAQEENLSDDRLSRLRYDNSGGDAGLPVAMISRQMAAYLFDSIGDTKKILSQLQDAAGANRTGGATNSASSANLSLSIDLIRHEVQASNVVGILEGSDPVLKNEAIVIGAHYDHLGRGGDGSLAPKEGEIHHGADDNASGTAGVLELARLFGGQRPRPRRTLVFIAFSGEEEGLLGSNYYVNHPIIPLANTVAMINMDMVGRMKNRGLIIGGVGTAPEWRAMIDSANFLQTAVVTATASPRSVTPTGVPVVVSANGSTIVTSDTTRQFQLTLNEDGFGPSDHSSFYAKQIPVLFFWTGTHEDYHKPSDTADKINYDDEARILMMAAHVIQDIDAADKRPTYTVARTEATGRATGFRVYLGTIPNYADSNDGLLLDGVREDSPAAKAGLKAGDRIVKLAGRDVRNVYDYTAALGEMKAGQEYVVELMRGGERLSLKLTPAARK